MECHLFVVFSSSPRPAMCHSEAMTLNPVQLRTLGSLIEKEIVTPEIYPLSLNALVNACNQKSSRDPVMELDEETVRQALHGLEELGLVGVVRDARVAKFENKARTVFNLRRDETAVMCLLLLRGPQTLGELRSRADRLFAFDDIAAVESALTRLSSRPPAEHPGDGATGPLVTLLPRQPGSREARYAHLLGELVESAPMRPARTSESSTGSTEASNAIEDRMAALEAEVARLRSMVTDLAAKLAQDGEAVER